MRCNITVSVSIDSSGCDLFRMLRLPKQFVHRSLPLVWKCNYQRDNGQTPYRLPDLWPPNSPDLIKPIDYKIRSIIQQRIYQTKVQDVNDLTQRLIDVWSEVEQNAIDDAIDLRCLRATGRHFEYSLWLVKNII